jgi:hypothetical protein
LKERLSRITTVRLVIVSIAVVALSAAISGPTLASGSGTAVASSEAPTIFIRGGSASSLKFVGPKTINEGEELRIVNQSNVKKVGPQTFSLVEESDVPKTKSERELCAKKGHICSAIMGWHRIKAGGPAKVNPVTAGEEGWDTPGEPKVKGDSWYTGMKPGASFEQQVTAGATIAPVTLTFVSAFDPDLHGSIKVLPLR